MTGHCRFYEVNEEAKAEHESWLASLPQAMREQEEYFENHPEACGQEPTEDPKTSNFYPECYDFCRFLVETPGFPGEHLTCCSCPGNTKILDCYFSINEII